MRLAWKGMCGVAEMGKQEESIKFGRMPRPLISIGAFAPLA